MNEERQPQGTGADRQRAAGRRNLLQVLPELGVPGPFIVVILTVLLVLTVAPYLAGVEVGPLGTLPALDPSAGTTWRRSSPSLPGRRPGSPAFWRWRRSSWRPSRPGPAHLRRPSPASGSFPS